MVLSTECVSELLALPVALALEVVTFPATLGGPRSYRYGCIQILNQLTDDDPDTTTTFKIGIEKAHLKNKNWVRTYREQDKMQ